MKTLTFTIIILLQIATPLLAQHSSTNQIQVNTQVEDGITILNWEVNREVNSSYFIIERSINQEAFEVIDTKKANSSTFKTTHYIYEDVENASRNSQYRVKLVLMDGSVNYATTEITIDSNLARIVAK
jgi:hypothetical protein